MATKPSPKISNTAFANVAAWLANIGPSYRSQSSLVATDQGNGLRQGQKNWGSTPHESTVRHRRRRDHTAFMTKHAEQQSPPIAVVLVSHDLRVANEGIDIEQIAPMFD